MANTTELELDLFDLFTDDLRLHVLSKLDAQQVATMAAVSRHWHALATSQELWQHLCSRDHNVGDTPPSTAPQQQQPINSDWLFTYKRLEAVQSLKEVTWLHPGHVDGAQPPGVEGHGACSWGRHGMLLWGGFGSIFPEQVFALKHTNTGLSWRLLRVVGNCPRLRYGHTLTRCGRDGDMALVMGGMTRGGYGGEVLDVAVLRRAAGEEQEVYEWHVPDFQGDAPHPRGYHSATASPDGTKIYVFGGMVRRSCCNTFAVLDTTSWTWSYPQTSGDPPPERFGHSGVVWDDKLWVVGGGYGNDLLRSGHDYEDVHCLDLVTWEWSRVLIKSYAPRDCMGRCHASVLLGSKLVLFGGSLQTCCDLRYIDLNAKEMGEMRLGGPLPMGRLSHTLVDLGNDCLALYGGWAESYELSELALLQLVPRSLWTAEERASRSLLSGPGAARAGLPVHLMAQLIQQGYMAYAGMELFAGNDDEEEDDDDDEFQPGTSDEEEEEEDAGW